VGNSQRYGNLPKIAYISDIAHTNNPAPQDYHTNTTIPILYGASASGLLATIVHPNDYIDGVAPCSKGDTAYCMVNDPFIMELYKRHGVDLCFVGVVLTQHLTEPTSVNAANQMAVNLVRDILGADAAIMHKPGGGAPHLHVANVCRLLEDTGVKAVATNFAAVYPLFDNPEPQFGIICSGWGARPPSIEMDAVQEVFGFHYTMADPPKGSIKAGLYCPMTLRGGEKYTTIVDRLPIDDPYLGATGSEVIVSDRTAAQRAVDMAVDKVLGRPWEPEADVTGTEVPSITPAPGITDITTAKIAFINGGGLVHIGETPFPSARNVDGSYATYDITGVDSLKSEDWEVHHGGYTQSWIKADPNRFAPIDVLRQMEAEGKFGELFNTMYTWSALAFQMLGCRLLGEALLPLLKAAGVQGVIHTNT